MATLKSSVNADVVRLEITNGSYTSIGHYQVSVNTINKQTIGGFLTVSQTDSYAYIFFKVYGTFVSNDTFEFENVQLIDLTQWFNDNIPTTLTADNFSLYHNYGDYIQYNAGELVASNGKYLVSYGRNVWDEQWEQGYFNPNTGADVSNSDRIRTTNYVRVIPNKDYILYSLSGLTTDLFIVLYYDKNKTLIHSETAHNIANGSNFTIPSDVEYIRFYTGGSWYGGSYKNDITISIYYTGEDYSQYYPYEEPHVYDTGDETLLSTGVKINETSGLREDIFDYKTPDGNIVHRVGSVKLNTRTWQYDSGNKRFISYDRPSGIVRITDTSVKQNIVSSRFISIKQSDANGNTNNMVISTYDGYLYIVNNNYTDATLFTNSLTDNDILFYPLATQTTEQGTSFAENVDIDDFGSMGWYSAYTNESTNTSVNVPQGCRLFYQAWYRGFIDTLGQREDIDWDANNIASKTDLIKKEDLTSQLSDVAGLTFQIKKAYRIGNVVFITIRAKNETASAINANVEIANATFLPSYSLGYAQSFPCVKYHDGTNTIEKMGLAENGAITVDSAIDVNDFVFINIALCI